MSWSTERKAVTAATTTGKNENPEIVDEIRHHVQSEKLAHGETPRELSDKERQEIAAYGQADRRPFSATVNPLSPSRPAAR